LLSFHVASNNAEEAESIGSACFISRLPIAIITNSQTSIFSTSGSIHSHLSGNVGKFGPVFRDTGNPGHRFLIQHQDHKGLVGHAFVFAPDPVARCGNEAEPRVITGMAQDNKDIEVRKL
jgi:hypothetical protein